jgi:catecholate siderophore receptor
MTPIHLLPLGALAAGFGVAGVAFAQAAPAAEEPAQLPVVRAKARAEPQGKDSVQATTTRIGKGLQELRDVPQSVTVVTEKLIDDRNLDTLRDALKNTAGISFLAAEGGEEDIRLRGFSLQATGDIFIDGLRDPAFYDRDSFNWDRLEVLRGSASMLFGRGSTGGAVNQVSKQPIGFFDQHEVAVTLGSGDYLRATGDFNFKTGTDAAFRLNVMQTVADGWGRKIDKVGVAPTFRWGIGTADEFSVGLYHLDNHNGVNYGLPWVTPTASNDNRLVPVAPKAYYGAASDYSAGGVTLGTLSHIHRFADRSELRTVLRAADYERDQRASAIRFAPAAMQPGGLAVNADTIGPDTVVRRSGGGVHLKNMQMRTVAAQSDYSGKHRWGGFEHSVQAGADLAHEKFQNNGLSPFSPTLLKPNTTLGSPNDGAAVDESLRLLRRTQSFEAKAIGVYAQNLVQIAPTWKLLGGLRWDRFQGRYEQPELTNASGVVTQAQATRARTDSLWSQRFGVLWQPTPLASFHVSYATSFNASGETYRFDALGSNTPPERSRNVEIGAKVDAFDGRLSTRVALFHTTKYNERNRDEESVNPTNYVLSGERHAAGVELDIAGRITPAWEVYASYAWIPSAAVDKASSVNGTTLIGETVGQRPGLTPRHTGTLWTTYRLTPAWRVGAGLNARSSDSPQQSTIVAPRFVTADLMAEYTMGELSFKANLTNVADKLYADVLYRGHYIAGKPRTLQLTTAYKF